MTQSPSQGSLVEVRPQPNVYTVMLVVAIIALALAIAMAFWKLTSPEPVGYGMQIGQFFDPIRPPAP